MISEILSGLPLWATPLAQGTACAALGLAASYLLSRHPARAHQVLLAGVLTAVLTPALYLLVHHFGLGAFAASTGPALPEPVETVLVELADIKELSAVEGVSVPPVVELAEPPATVTPLPWRAILLRTWVVTSLLLLGRFVLRLGLGLHLLRVSEPLKCNKLQEALAAAKARVGVNASVRLRRSERVRSPVIWCWSRRPVLLVHDGAEEADANADWVSVFSHELAHWRRRDQFVGLLAELLTAAVPWHPLAWWIERRLLRLSEEVCDDWAVAGAPTGVDYAESLLNLSPERQWAFLPTVVGKEKAMKERIRRIVRDRCSNPKIGVRWTAAVCILAVLATVGVAFAQRRPVERDRREAEEREEMRLDAEKRELAIAGRRNVLRRLLEQLVAQTRDIEASLRDGGDAMGEEGQVRRAELDALREHIALLERQLQALGRRDRGRDAPPEFERHADELRRHQHELMSRTGRLELELRELGDSQPDRRERVEAELRAVGEERRAVDREMANIGRRRAEIERVRATEARERARDSAQRAAHVKQLTERLRRLEISAAENDWALDELEDRDSDEAQKLRQSVERIEREKADVRRELEILERQRRGRDRDIEIIETRRRRVGDEQQEDLRAAIEETERELHERRQRGEGDADESRALLRSLQALTDRQQEIEARGRARSSRRRRGTPPESAPYDEMVRTDDGRIEIMRERRITRDDPPEGGLESEVEELRKKVDGMHKQMEEMRRMLQQLLERDPRENETPPKETNAY